MTTDNEQLAINSGACLTYASYEKIPYNISFDMASLDNYTKAVEERYAAKLREQRPYMYVESAPQGTSILTGTPYRSSVVAYPKIPLYRHPMPAADDVSLINKGDMPAGDQIKPDMKYMRELEERCERLERELNGNKS